MFDKIIDLHLNQDYGHFGTGSVIDSIVAKYPLFPNEALYVIDCKQAQVEPLSKNFGEIIGIDRPHQNELSILYEHISKENMEAVVQWVQVALRSGFDKSMGIQCERDIFKCLYQTATKRTLLKCTSGYARDSNGTPRYCIGKFIDLTELVPFHHFSYTFLGPNRHKILKRYHDVVSNNERPLSRREVEVLKWVGEGLSSADIADKLFISRTTVDKHRRNIIKKMGTVTAMEAFHKAINQGLF